MPPNDFLDRAFPFPAHHEDDPETETLLGKYFFGRETLPIFDDRPQHMLRTIDLFGSVEFINEYNTTI